MQDLLGTMRQEFQMLLDYPYAQEFFLLLYYCCNHKIMHLLRSIGPHIMLYAQCFDEHISQTFAQYYDIDFNTPFQIQHLPLDGTPLTDLHLIALARHQLRCSADLGGLRLVSMEEVAMPAFLVARLKHFRQLAEEGVRGPYLMDCLTASTSLFTEPLRKAYSAVLQRGAVAIHSDQDQHRYDAAGMFLPDTVIYHDPDPATATRAVAKTLSSVINQNHLSKWYRAQHPNIQFLQQLKVIHPTLGQRLDHLSPVVYTAPHDGFDLPPNLAVKHRPNAFLTCLLPDRPDGLSKHQLSMYFKLLLGLRLPPINTDNQCCPCGVQVDLYGFHRLNCKRGAGPAFKSGHNTVQDQLAYELRRLNLSVVSQDAKLRQQFSHLTSKKRGDLAVDAESTQFRLLTPGQIPRDKFILDVSITAMVNGRGQWGGVFNRETKRYANHTLVQKQTAKFTKHGHHYARIGFAFAPFVGSSYGTFGPTMARLLMGLANEELRQHDSYRTRVGLDPLVDPSARAQFRALCYRQSSARIGHALAKATVKRLLATPSLPIPSPVPRSLAARNRPGPADFVSLSPPHLSSHPSSLSPV